MLDKILWATIMVFLSVVYFAYLEQLFIWQTSRHNSAIHPNYFTISMGYAGARVCIRKNVQAQ